MLKWAFMFLVLAFIAAAFGFTGVAAASAGIAKTLFAIFLFFFLALVIAGLAIGKKVA